MAVYYDNNIVNFENGGFGHKATSELLYIVSVRHKQFNWFVMYVKP